MKEQRLIYADEPINAFKRYAKNHPNATWNAFGIEEVLNTAKVVDAVEVVRCEKCRYYFDGVCANYKNRVAIRVPDFGDNYKYVEELKVAKDHFCSYGERRSDD